MVAGIPSAKDPLLLSEKQSKSPFKKNKIKMSYVLNPIKLISNKNLEIQSSTEKPRKSCHVFITNASTIPSELLPEELKQMHI